MTTTSMQAQPGSGTSDMPRGDMGSAASAGMPRGEMNAKPPATGMPQGAMNPTPPAIGMPTGVMPAAPASKDPTRTGMPSATDRGGGMPTGAMVSGTGQGMPSGAMRPASDSTETWNMDVVAPYSCGCN